MQILNLHLKAGKITRTAIMDEVDLKHIFFGKFDGRKILRCIQCGTCSASCPLTDQMDYAPRELFALIRDGEMITALRSNTLWYCVSCYYCIVRCPQEIPVTDLIYALKQMAVQQGLCPACHKLPDMYHSFTRVVAQYGRVNETVLMARYALRHPVDALGNLPMALRMFLKRRLDLFPSRLRQPDRIARLLAEAKRQETP